MTNFTSSGLALYKILQIIVLIQTDFPDPVVPAMSRCGILAKFSVLISPVVVLPIAKVSKDSALANSVLFTTDLKKQFQDFG